MERNWIVLLLGLALVLGAVVLWRSGRESPPSLSLADLREKLIPAEGTLTTYGIALSWNNAQLFADWYYEIRLNSSEEMVLRQALEPIPTPCCDDTRLVRCCCEKGGLICNLVRSARGLAAWLIREKGFKADEVRAAVEEWLRFIHPDYFLAQELLRLGRNPANYGLPAKGSCYRGWCEMPLKAGGCGGMGLVVKL